MNPQRTLRAEGEIVEGETEEEGGAKWRRKKNNMRKKKGWQRSNYYAEKDISLVGILLCYKGASLIDALLSTEKQHPSHVCPEERHPVMLNTLDVRMVDARTSEWLTHFIWVQI
jgi:hypothetical protein